AVNAVAFSPDGKQLAAGLANNAVLHFDLGAKDFKPVKTLTGHTGAVSALAFTPSGSQLLSASADKTVQVWDLPGGTAKAKLEHGATVTGLALSKDGKQVASCGA